MTELQSAYRLSYCCSFETFTVKFLQLMRNVFGTVPIYPVPIETSIAAETWHLSTDFSDTIFRLNSPSVPYILFAVKVKLLGVMKYLCQISIF